VPLPVPAPSRHAGLIYSRNRALPLASMIFVECLKAYLAEIAAKGLDI